MQKLGSSNSLHTYTLNLSVNKIIQLDPVRSLGFASSCRFFVPFHPRNAIYLHPFGTQGLCILAILCIRVPILPVRKFICLAALVQDTQAATFMLACKPASRIYNKPCVSDRRLASTNPEGTHCTRCQAMWG